MRSFSLLALAASWSPVSSAVLQGFNYGSTQSDGSFKVQSDFESEFQTAQNLVGTSGFTSARLYTCIVSCGRGRRIHGYALTSIQQGGTANTPTSAIPAAIAQDTTLLLGMWASSGSDVVNSEIAALQSAISTYGTAFTSLVVGISVGSEDLYRTSPTGIAAKAGVGTDPNTLVGYINQLRSALQGTPLSGVKIGHVDTWTAWVNGSNSAVIDAVDWLGMDAYPYFQDTMSNGIDNGASLFFDAYDATVAVAGGKDVWITETGWPVSGPTSNLAVPSTQNAQTYWDQVGCAKAFGQINTYWFALQDADPVTPSPSFGVVGSTLSTTPLYDLSCSAVSSSNTSQSAVASASGYTNASPASSASQTAVATGVSGLSPHQGVGVGGNGNQGGSNSSGTVATTMSAAKSGVPYSATVLPNGTYLGTTATAGTPTSTSTHGVSSNGAIAGSVSLAAGGLAAVFAIMAAL
jgi:glucan endo-1,3-beta-D-glucosidase